MQSEKWDEITARYQDEYTGSRYDENARGILNLIPRIRDDPVFANVVPSTSLTALRLVVSSKDSKIIVWYESGEYTISIETEGVDEEESKVTDAEVVSTLQEYIHKVSGE